jgi:Flp pilus assembly pilin Flp
MSLKHKKGQALIEYALILIIIAVTVVVAMLLVRSQINSLFGRLNNLTAAPAASAQPNLQSTTAVPPQAPVAEKKSMVKPAPSKGQ